jgi:hypothetical protein
MKQNRARVAVLLVARVRRKVLPPLVAALTGGYGRRSFLPFAASLAARPLGAVPSPPACAGDAAKGSRA